MRQRSGKDEETLVALRESVQNAQTKLKEAQQELQDTRSKLTTLVHLAAQVASRENWPAPPQLQFIPLHGVVASGLESKSHMAHSHAPNAAGLKQNSIPLVGVPMSQISGGKSAGQENCPPRITATSHVILSAATQSQEQQQASITAWQQPLQTVQATR